ncbi:MAG: SDR family NAD(P)-dependent oxidoreductase, partial [Deltaproteobacteria bacterium]|nr:SDR family NAD(P)-dependent oxidoreductase [Deltaproteobacteria bacterium]
MQISNDVVLVTGGASGLGEATARRFVADGAKVVALDMNEERGAALAKELEGELRFVK